jgi:hypothetical protein
MSILQLSWFHSRRSQLVLIPCALCLSTLALLRAVRSHTDLDPESGMPRAQADEVHRTVCPGGPWLACTPDSPKGQLLCRNGARVPLLLGACLIEKRGMPDVPGAADFEPADYPVYRTWDDHTVRFIRCSDGCMLRESATQH